MASEQPNFFYKTLKEIDEKLQSLKRILLERAESEDQSEELDEQSEELEELDEGESINYELVYFKYWFDGCKTIDNVLSRIEALKEQFEQWKKEGHELTQPVDTGYCYIDKMYKEENYTSL